MICINDMIHGFRVTGIVPVPELSGTLYQLLFEKTNTPLYYLERKDETKTFLIALRTIPFDDSGVFHMLEHSVLDGSEKYPMKSPIVELLKSSLQIDLNAMTSSDVTSYYCCSAIPKDFTNLIDVYMDAVFHPLCVKTPVTFLQEGWHYELDEQGNLSVNGVVLNEMRSAVSGWRSLLEQTLSRAVFPDTCYRFASGGIPDRMPELSWETFCQTYEKFYHPSNARIILDGAMDLHEVLPHISEVLTRFDRKSTDDMKIGMQDIRNMKALTCRYGISPGEKQEKRDSLTRAWIYGTWEDKEITAALCLLRDILFGSNEAPVPKALYEKGLCQKATMVVDTSALQSVCSITLKDTDAGSEEKIWNLVYDTLRGIIRDGISGETLSACLDTYEFNWREQGSSEKPRGLVYAMNILESVLYGGPAAYNLSCRDVFAALRERIGTGWYEDLLRTLIVDQDNYASVTLIASPDFYEDRAGEQQEILNRKKESMTPAELSRIKRDMECLLDRQMEETPEEILDLLPKVTLSDIPLAPVPVPNEVSSFCGVPVLHQDLPTNQIIYLKLYFECSDLDPEEMKLVDFMTEMYGNLPTFRSDSQTLRRRMDQYFGSFEVSVDFQRQERSRTKAETYLVAEISFLEEKQEQALCLLGEILKESDYDNPEKIHHRLSQRRRSKETALRQGGAGMALSRAERGISVYHILEDESDGIPYLEFLIDLDERFDTKGTAAVHSYQKMAARILTRNRLILSITGKKTDALVNAVMELFEEGEKCRPCEIRPEAFRTEIHETLAEVSAAAMILDLSLVPGYDPERFLGITEVASQILTYEYLWNEVREIGGAYDVSMTAFRDGTLHLSSSEDPNPSRTLKCFRKIGQKLREYAGKSPDLTGYIISVIGEDQSEADPRFDGLEADTDYLCRMDPEEDSLERARILGTTHQDLLALADYIDLALLNPAVCVCGPESQCGILKKETASDCRTIS